LLNTDIFLQIPETALTEVKQLFWVQAPDFLSALVDELFKIVYNFKVEKPLRADADFPDNLKLDFSRGILVRTAEKHGATGDFHQIPSDGHLSIPLVEVEPSKPAAEGVEDPDSPSVAVCVACVPFKAGLYSEDEMLDRHLSFVDSASKKEGYDLCAYLHCDHFRMLINHPPGNDLYTYWTPAMKEAMKSTAPSDQQLYAPTSTEVLGAKRNTKGAGVGSQHRIKFATAAEHDAADSSDHIKQARNRLHFERLRCNAWKRAPPNADLESALALPNDKKIRSFPQLRSFLQEHFKSSDETTSKAGDPLEYDEEMGTFGVKENWREDFPTYADITKELDTHRAHQIFSNIHARTSSALPTAVIAYPQHVPPPHPYYESRKPCDWYDSPSVRPQYCEDSAYAHHAHHDRSRDFSYYHRSRSPLRRDFSYDRRRSRSPLRRDFSYDRRRSRSRDRLDFSYDRRRSRSRDRRGDSSRDRRRSRSRDRRRSRSRDRRRSRSRDRRGDSSREDRSCSHDRRGDASSCDRRTQSPPVAETDDISLDNDDDIKA
jgi:hypothetical protein